MGRAVVIDDKEDVDALVARIRAGAADDFALIVHRYKRDVWNILARLLHDDQTTENLVQQCFVNAFQRLDTYQPGRDFRSWLRGIARHLAQQQMRRRQREARNLHRYYDHLRSENGRPEDRKIDFFGETPAPRTLEKRLRKCEEALPTEARRALNLRYERGWDLPQVAAAMGRTVAGTRQLLYRARRLLKACIEELENIERISGD